MLVYDVRDGEILKAYLKKGTWEGLTVYQILADKEGYKKPLSGMFENKEDVKLGSQYDLYKGGYFLKEKDAFNRFYKGNIKYIQENNGIFTFKVSSHTRFSFKIIKLDYNKAFEIARKYNINNMNYLNMDLIKYKNERGI